MAILRISSGSEFINAKIYNISAELTASNDDTAGKSKSKVNKKERELIILKRQKKAIVDDVDEALQRCPTIEDAYSSALLTKVISAFKKRRKVPEQSLYAKRVLSYYDSVRHHPLLKRHYVEKYCHLRAVWLPGMTIKCIRVVPKPLESDDLAYLFGVRETDLSEPRNGITLGRNIYDGLNMGWIVIVPDKPRYGEEAIWRCIVVQQSIASHLLDSGSTWKDIDGKALKFLTPNRPARRYLYLRYVLTFLQQQRLGNVKWLDYLKERGNLWGLPGPYLRKSMLLALSRRFSDQGLPECFYDSTFTVADGCPQRSAEVEDDLAMGLDYKMQDYFSEVNRDRESWEEWSDNSDDAWSDDSDTEEEASDGFGRGDN